METNLYSKNDLLLFHITGGGGNNKKLTCEGIKKITDCTYWCYLFQEENGLFDSNGNELMSKKELETALRTGEGRLEIDGYYNTYYTEKLGDISLEEFKAMNSYYQKIYLSVYEYGFGGDSDCDDHYNEEYIESVYDNWDGGLY